MTQGIYAIINKTHQRAYIGLSTHVEARWRTHVQHLNTGVHANEGLQTDWSAFGPTGFTFEIIEEVTDVDQLIVREIEYIYQFMRQHGVYNVRSTPKPKRQRGSLVSTDQAGSSYRVVNCFLELIAQKCIDEQRVLSAAAIGRDLGLSRHTVNALTHNTLREYPTSLIVKLCVYFGCDINDLLVLVTDTSNLL